VHICPNECVAFVGEYESLETCPRCHASRYDTRRKPVRVFIYMPVVQQLRRLFASADTAEWVRWAGEHAKTPGVVRDITESPGWQIHAVNTGLFDDIRNVALAFCSDGVNPFGKSAHSTWPLMLSVLNYPPHIRTRTDLMILLGLIPGPHAPANINVYISLFVNELVAYGEPGVWVHDSFKQEDFLLRFFLIQFIADYPAASKVLCLKGSNALLGCHKCVVRGHKTGKQATLYSGYRRWLPSDHDWRTDTDTFHSAEPSAAPRKRANVEIRTPAPAAKEAQGRVGVKPGSTRHTGRVDA